MAKRDRIILTGGGTGGHVYPAISVAEQLVKDPEVEAILYIGVKGHLEEKIARERGLEFIGLNTAGMPRKLSPELLVWPFQTSAAVLKAFAVLKDFGPTAVLGTGGYAAAPPLAAALGMRIPFAIHEPDAHPGVVNRLFARYANLVSCGMAAAQEKLHSERGPTVVNGNPVSESLLHLPARAAAAARLALSPELKTLFVTGGSQGAKAINDLVAHAAPAILSIKDPPLQILHQIGDKNMQEFEDSLPEAVKSNARYVRRPYFNDISEAYAVCDLALCRAGAMTIADLTTTGTPAVFIPYPYAAQDHQSRNAEFIASKGAAVVLRQSDTTAELLERTVEELLCQSEKLQAMKESMQTLGRPNAAKDLTRQLKNLKLQA